MKAKLNFIGILFIGGLLLFLAGCKGDSGGLKAVNAETNTGITVTKVTATKEKLPMGTTKVQIKHNKIDPKEIFGPPVDEAWATEGNVFLIFWVEINADSDKKRLELVRSAYLVDAEGNKYELDLWYFNEAYRVTHFISAAEGLGVGSETRLGFHILDPLPEGIKLMSDQLEVAFLKTPHK